MAYIFRSLDTAVGEDLDAQSATAFVRSTFPEPGCPSGESNSGLLMHEVGDRTVLRGFDPINGAKRIHRRSTSIRIRARVAAVELVLEGVAKPTLLQIASRIGRSERTLVEKFRIRDALFAFPPPELAPNFVDAWMRGRETNEFEFEFERLLKELDANPIARRLLQGLARIHRRNERFRMTDGFFSYAMRTEILGHNGSCDLLDWTSYVADAVRDALLDWASADDARLTDLVPRLTFKLRMIDHLSK